MSRKQNKLSEGQRPTSCRAYYAERKNPFGDAQQWCHAGGTFLWKSKLKENQGLEQLNIFFTCLGNPGHPALLLIHGYPTSSYDFASVVARLSTDYYVCALDMPGYGFSDKPRGSYVYSIFDDAQLIDYFIREKLKSQQLTLITHDRGNSVGLALLQIYQQDADQPYRLTHHIITNGNVYLPLARLTGLQRLLLHTRVGPVVSLLLPSALFARGLGKKTSTPPLSIKEVKALKSIFDYQSGTKIQDKLIQYLIERKANEVSWLKALERSNIPTTLIWGELDQIAPVAVADYVWGHYLKERTTPASYWRMPCANHYLQIDQPELLAGVIHSVLDSADAPKAVDAGCQPVMIL